MKNQKTPVGIIAGNGTLPFEVAHMILGQGRNCYLVGIKGEVDKQIEQFEYKLFEWGQIGRMVNALKKQKIVDVLLVGGVKRRPTIWQLKPDWGLWKVLPSLFKMLAMGDNKLLSMCIKRIEQKGFTVRTLAEMTPQLLIEDNEILGKKPSKEDLKKIKQGWEVVKVLGPYDVGQGAVVVGHRVIAVEGLEGTDEMLIRVQNLRKENRLPKKGGGVLVKCTKLGQDERADLPAIGPQTMHNLHKAKLNGVGVEAGRTIIIEREKTLNLAKKYGLFIYGFCERKNEK